MVRGDEKRGLLDTTTDFQTTKSSTGMKVARAASAEGVGMAYNGPADPEKNAVHLSSLRRRLGHTLRTVQAAVVRRPANLELLKRNETDAVGELSGDDRVLPN